MSDRYLYVAVIVDPYGEEETLGIFETEDLAQKAVYARIDPWSQGYRSHIHRVVAGSRAEQEWRFTLYGTGDSEPNHR
jgi:hypothetical protein